MAGARESDLVRLAGFPKGIDNLSREESTPRGALRAAVNVDLDSTGKLSRREGFALLQSLPGLHSLFADDRFPFLVGADANTLYLFDDTLQRTAAVTLQRDAPLHYALNLFGLFYSNGTDCGMIDLAGQRRPWSAPQPAGQPTLTVNPIAGGLTAGAYQLAITFLDADGMESGANNASWIDVPEGGGIVLTDWPEMPADAAAVNIYLSPANGDLMYLVDTLRPALPPSYLLGRRTSGKALSTLFLTPMPPATMLCVSNGRLFGNHQGTLIWSESLNYGLTKRSENWVQFPAISLIADASGNGLFVASENRTYFMEGTSPAQWRRRVVHTSGAVPGTRIYLSASSVGLDAPGVVPVWLSTGGDLIAGLPDGSIARLHKDTYIAPENAEHGGVALREHNGINQLLVTHKGGQISRLQAQDSVSVEVCRNGVVVG